MTETIAQLIKGDKVENIVDYTDNLPVNYVAVDRKTLGADGYMLSHPGLTLSAIGSGVDLGGYYNDRIPMHFRVSGDDLIRVAQSGGAVGVIGDIAPGGKQASMTNSFNTQAIVVNGRMWLSDGATVTEVTDSDLGIPIDITWIDGYYFLTDGETLYHTDINDETSIDPLKFSTSAFSPDPTLAVAKTADNYVLVLNRFTIEYFENRATPNFAFRRVDHKSIKVGIVATHCKTELDGRFFILGSSKNSDLAFFVIFSGQYKKLSTRAVDKIINTYSQQDLDQAVLETRVDENQKYIVVRLPNETLLYNDSIATKFGPEFAWSIIKSSVVGDVKWRGVNGVFDPRLPGWFYGDNQNANIGVLDDTTASQYGENVEGILYSPMIDLETDSIDSLEIDIIPGFQINISDITTAISLTYDGEFFGKEWFNLYGRKNDKTTRFIVNRLGYTNHNVGFKLRTVSPDKTAFSLMKINHG